MEELKKKAKEQLTANGFFPQCNFDMDTITEQMVIFLRDNAGNVSNDDMGNAAKEFTDANTDFTKLGIYTAYYNGARWMRDEVSNTNE